MIGDEVRAGAALLDNRLSNVWDLWINVGTLDIADPTLCILGQLFQDCRTGLGVLGIGQAAEYGFNAWGDGEHGSGDEYSSLTAQWRELIAQRRAQRRDTAQ